MSINPTPTPGAPTEYNTWLPDVKWTTFLGCSVVSGFLLAGISSWFHFDLAAWMQPTINSVSSAFGIDRPPGAQWLLAVLIGGAFSFIKKANYRDIVTKLTPAILRRASQDDNVNILKPSAVHPNAVIITPVPPAS